MAVPAMLAKSTDPAVAAATDTSSIAVITRSIVLFVSRKYEMASVVAVPTLVTICFTLGIMFFPAVNTLSTKS